MEKLIEFTDAQALPEVLFVDVRSPEEFLADHIPGAVNLPVLEDAERQRTGTCYHQLSPKEARQLGLELVAPKLPRLMKTLGGYALNHQVVLYCWRGGMRSGALSAVADLMRIPVYRLSHGYKGYRSYVNDYMQQMPAFSVYVLCGNTGVGKTEVLQELAAQGVQTLDLEGLANHRGSAFGSVGLGAQGSQKAFESGLWQKISQFDVTKPVVLECESRRIGRLLLPEHLHQLVRQATPILLYDNVPNRVARILADYQPAQEPAEVARALACIRPKLGKEKYDLLAAALEQQAYPLVIETLLSGYYDLLYQYPNGADARYPLAVDVAAGHGAAVIKGFLEQKELEQ